MSDEFIEGAEPDYLDPKVLEQLEEEDKKREGLQADEVRRLLARRREAYARVFTPGPREQADIDFVLNDLQWFCRMYVPTFDVRDGVNADTLSRIKEGRREVFQRIKDFSCLDGDALLMKYTDATTKQ